MLDTTTTTRHLFYKSRDIVLIPNLCTDQNNRKGQNREQNLRQK